MISSGELTKMRRASLFEEFAGSLKDLFEYDGAIVAIIGKIQLILPLNIENSLRPLIGQRITILRTDIPDKTYLFRVLSEESEKNEE